MTVRVRKTIRLGLLRISLTDRGVRYAVRLGPFTWRPGR